MKDGREWLAAEAQHDLMLMSTERGNYREAEAHARTALAWYPKYHERFPLFVADLAFLLVSEHEYRGAIRLLIRFFYIVKDRSKRVLALSMLVRALGGVKDLDRLRRARRRLLRWLEHSREYEPAARVNLAEGERAAGMWSEAEANARLALELASGRRDAAPARLASTLLSEISGRVPAEPPRSNPGVAQLVLHAEARIRAWVPSRRGRRPREQGGEDWAVA